MGDGMLSLSWNNHSATFCHTLSTLRAKERYTDVTVACDGKFYPVHKLVLSTCSEYFESMFESTPCKHPVIVLRDVQSDELEALLSYMYAGVVSVAQSDLSRLIKVAELLQIKGLAVPDEPPNSTKRSHDDRLRHGNKNSPNTRSRANLGSDGRVSPYPKRRRRTDTDVSHEDSHSSSSAQSPNKSLSGEKDHEVSRTGMEEDSQNSMEQGGQESLMSNVQVTLGDDAVVKEEVVEEGEDRRNESDIGHEYNSNDHDSSTIDQDGRLMMPKFDQHEVMHSSLANAPPLTEAVIEALAGPSGMQGWPGGGDLARLALGDSYADGSHDYVTLDQSGSQMVSLVEVDQNRDQEGYSEGYSEEYTEGYSGSKGINTSLRNGKRFYHCPYCPYKTNKHIQRHLRMHTGEKPFGCPYCEFRASQKVHLDKHIRTHTGERPYACPECPMAFTQTKSLKKHMMKHVQVL